VNALGGERQLWEGWGTPLKTASKAPLSNENVTDTQFLIVISVLDEEDIYKKYIKDRKTELN
jgi:hypothetical protein